MIWIYARTYGPERPDLVWCAERRRHYREVDHDLRCTCDPEPSPGPEAWVGRRVERKGVRIPYRPEGSVRLDPETLRVVVEEGLDFRRDVEGRARVRRG